MRGFLVRYAEMEEQGFVVLIDSVDDDLILGEIDVATERMCGERRQAVSVREIKKEKLSDIMMLFSPSQTLGISAVDEDVLCGPDLLANLTIG